MTHLAFDADDTLWAHENVFVDAKSRCLDVLSAYVPDVRTLEERLYAFEKHNLKLFGYGVKGFVLSMLETAIELSDGKISGGELQRIIDIGKEMLVHPIDLLPGVEATLKALRDDYTLLIITKGDLFDQENKIARSGLAPYFTHVEILSEKNKIAYRDVLARHGIPAEQFLMIGNSVKSDILPVLQLGSQALHVPYEYTWMHEKQEVGELPGYDKITSLAELPAWLATRG